MTGGLLAFDLARRVGWAYVPTKYRSPAFAMSAEEFKLMCFGSKTLAAPGSPNGELYLVLHRWMHDILQEYTPDYVAIEAPFVPVANFRGAGLMFGLAAIVEMHAHHRNIPLCTASISAIKKHWTGAGNAKKPLMMAEAYNRGLQVPDDNAADACALADFVVADLTRTGAWPLQRRAYDERDRVGTAGAG